GPDRQGHFERATPQQEDEPIVTQHVEIDDGRVAEVQIAFLREARIDAAIGEQTTDLGEILFADVDDARLGIDSSMSRLVAMEVKVSLTEGGDSGAARLEELDVASGVLPERGDEDLVAAAVEGLRVSRLEG